MLAWITGNLGTILITLLLLLIVTCIIRSMIKDRKQGRSTCGGNCAHCRRCHHAEGMIWNGTDDRPPSGCEGALH